MQALIQTPVSDRWRVESAALEDGRVLRYQIHAGKTVLSYAQFVELLATDEQFRSFFNATLAAAPFAAFFWETPPVTRASFGQDFEFVLVDAPALAGVAANAQAFSEQFSRCQGEVVAVFANLGGDATLIAPCPQAVSGLYAHLGVFVRKAPVAQRDALWQRLGAAVKQGLAAQPRWVSTSGLGVYWLHIRLDRRPKYYTWRPYTDTSR